MAKPILSMIGVKIDFRIDTTLNQATITQIDNEWELRIDELLPRGPVEIFRERVSTLAIDQLDNHILQVIEKIYIK